jgi:hypothetical protein
MNKLILIIIILLIIPFGLFAGDDKNLIEDYHYFSQKAGMIPYGSHSFYLRTNDEFTGFSTFFLGYRYGLSDFFQIGFEGGIGIQVYLASLVLHFKLFESPDYRFFIGIRNRSGFKYQNTYLELGKTLLDDERLGFYIATDLTFAVRFGENKRRSVYFTVYPLFDIDVTGRPVEIYLAPIHLGYELIFKRNQNWSFAIEAGIFLALNDVPETNYFYISRNLKRVGFPNLANIGFYYRSRP